MLEINFTDLKGVLIISLQGRLDGITSKTLIEKASLSQHANHAKIILDCAGLTYISSEGLRSILINAKRAQSLGGALTLCNANESVNEVMNISGFAALLGVHPDLEHAISAIS